MQGSQTFSIQRAFPSKPVMGAFVTAALTAHWAERTFVDRDRFLSSAPAHILTGAFLFVGVIGAIYVAERSFFKEIASLRKGSGSDKAADSKMKLEEKKRT
jgi:hypothetical protein